MKPMRLAVLLLVSSLCFAQEFSRYEVSGGISYGGIDTSDVKTPKGFAGSFATNVNRWLSMETSVGAQLQTQSVVLSGSTTTLNTGFYSFLSGPRLSYRRGRVTPFAHGLFGWARSLDYTKATYNATNLTFTVPYGNQLGAAAGGGTDYWITPHIALRTQGDYFLTQPDGTFGFHMTNNFRIVGGIVFSFGSTPTMTASMSKPHTPPSRRQPREDALAKQESQTAAPTVVANITTPSQPQLQPASQPVPGASMGAIQSSSVVTKQTSTPAAAPAPVATITPKQDMLTPPAKPAVVVNTAPTPPPPAAVAPRQDPFTPPAKAAVATPVVNTATAPAPVATALVQRPAPAPTPAVRPPAPARVTPPAPQPEEQFSLGEYARKLREKKESQPKDWN